MPIGQYFRGLNAYDILGNVIPGTIVLVVVMGFLPNPPIPESFGGYGLFIVLAFSVGAVVQEHSSKAVGSREHFNKTMDSVETLPNLQESKDDGDVKDDTKGSTFWTIFHPLIGPLCGWKRPARGQKLDDKILANRIWEHLIDTHEIPFSTRSYSVLYHVMLSRVDDIRSPSRATRIQAIRNFYRGMWVTSWYSLILIFTAQILDMRFQGKLIPIIEVPYQQPSYFLTPSPVWFLLLITFTSVFVFWFLSESAEEDFIEYLFADYSVAMGPDLQEIKLQDRNSSKKDKESGSTDFAS